jgi:hypothetical protein
MKPIDSFEKLIRDLHVLDINTSAEMDRRILHDTLKAQQKLKQTKLAGTQPDIRRIIMKSPITKLAAAAVIIALVVLGLFELIHTDSTSGVVWAEVARKVQASRGVIFRTVRHDTPDPYDRGVDFSMDHYSSTQSRLDAYKGGEINRTIYSDCNTKTVILVDHYHKSYVKMTGEETMPDGFRMADPNHRVQSYLSCEHRELGPKTIDGVLCEGIEVTDPASFGGDNPPESVMARVWVSVETGYPVRIEAEYVIDNGQSRFDFVQDQFQWDVELDESLFEPNIPADYIDISPY